MNNKICINANSCKVTCLKTNEIKLRDNRIGNVHLTFLELPPSNLENCLVSSITQIFYLWHNRLGHASTNVINELCKLDLRGLPKVKI